MKDTNWIITSSLFNRSLEITTLQLDLGVMDTFTVTAIVSNLIPTTDTSDFMYHTISYLAF